MPGANTVARRFPEHASEWVGLLMKLDLAVSSPTNRWLDASLRLTREHGVTFHDASYHALAVLGDGVFVTADGRYVARARAAGHLALLGDWTPPSGR